MPKNSNKKIGNHSITIMGFKNEEKLLIFANSWGKEWGDNGVGYLPFEYYNKYVIESWVGASSIFQKDKIIFKEGTIKDSRGLEIPFQLAQMPSLSFNQHFYVINFTDPQNVNKYIGWCHFYLNQSQVEIEELYIEKQYRGLGLGSALLGCLTDMVFTSENINFKEIIGYISINDLPNEIFDRLVCNFWKKNGFSILMDNSRFKGCYYKVIKKF